MEGGRSRVSIVMQLRETQPAISNFEDEREPQAKKCRQPLEAGKEKEMYSIPFQMYSLLVFVCLGCHNKTPQFCLS